MGGGLEWLRVPKLLLHGGALAPSRAPGVLGWPRVAVSHPRGSLHCVGCPGSTGDVSLGCMVALPHTRGLSQKWQSRRRQRSHSHWVQQWPRSPHCPVPWAWWHLPHRVPLTFHWDSGTPGQVATPSCSSAFVLRMCPGRPAGVPEAGERRGGAHCAPQVAKLPSRAAAPTRTCPTHRGRERWWVWRVWGRFVTQQ